jgi:hypothetical protein
MPALPDRIIAITASSLEMRQLLRPWQLSGRSPASTGRQELARHVESSVRQT